MSKTVESAGSGYRPTRRQVSRGLAVLAGAALVGAPRAALRRLPVVVGHAFPGSGPHAASGLAVKDGIAAAAAEFNASAEAQGLELQVDSHDDGGDAARSLALAGELATRHELAAWVCPVGAARLRQLMPWAERARVPIVGARSPAETQRLYHRWTFFGTAGCADQVEVLLRQLRTLGVRSIGALFANEPDATETWQHLFAGARAASIQVARAESFSADGRGAPAAVRAVAAASPDVVVLCCGGAPGVQAVRLLLEAGVAPARLYATSLLDPHELLRAGLPACDGMAFVQVMPLPDDPRHALSGAYRRALQRVSGAEPSAAGLEGYLSMQIVLRALRTLKGVASGEALAGALEQAGHFELGGLPIRYDRTQHRGSRHAEMAMLSGGRLRR